MQSVGSACLVVGLGAALYAVAASVYGAVSGRREFVVSGRRAMYCLAALTVTAMVVLEIAYVSSDFSFALVAQNSSRETPLFYKLGAVWSSQAGSLLLWVMLLSIFSSAVLYATRHKHREIAPWAAAVLGVVGAFFLCLQLFYASPFDTLVNVPADGAGLNPLLRHPVMMIHPPMLYTGYVAFSVPFAFAVGALITRNTDASWIRSTRAFALLAWTFLGFGVLLGALWSYSELGWGGYWAWDPVENASLLPWLVGTAFIHSIQVQEKRGMLKVWNVSLIVGAFVLALLGTFLVRSGVLDSIHAFGESTLGVPFLGFIGAVLVFSVVLIVSRLPYLKTEARLDSFLSRESIFLLNNLVLVGMAFVVFWGTFFPLISEAVNGKKASVGPPWFDRYTVPLALLLVLLTGIGPVLAWRRATWAGLRRTLALPAAVAGAGLVLLLGLTPAGDDLFSLAMFVFATFVLAVVGQEMWRGAAARRLTSGDGRAMAFLNLIRRNRRRYGGYTVHAGIALLFVGIAASSAFQERKDVRLAPGQTVAVGDYKVTYEKPTSTIGKDTSATGAPITLGAVMRVQRGAERFTVRPQRNYYPSGQAPPGDVFGSLFDGEATSEVDVRWGVKRTFWLAMRPDLSQLEKPIALANRKFGADGPNVQGIVASTLVQAYAQKASSAQFTVLVSPLVVWIWIGGGIAVLGALIALWPAGEGARSRVRAAAAARVGRELTRA